MDQLKYNNLLISQKGSSVNIPIMCVVEFCKIIENI